MARLWFLILLFGGMNLCEEVEAKSSRKKGAAKKANETSSEANQTNDTSKVMAKDTTEIMVKQNQDEMLNWKQQQMMRQIIREELGGQRGSSWESLYLPYLVAEQPWWWITALLIGLFIFLTVGAKTYDYAVSVTAVFTNKKLPEETLDPKQATQSWDEAIYKQQRMKWKVPLKSRVPSGALPAPEETKARMPMRITAGTQTVLVQVGEGDTVLLEFPSLAGVYPELGPVRPVRPGM